MEIADEPPSDRLALAQKPASKSDIFPMKTTDANPLSATFLQHQKTRWG